MKLLEATGKKYHNFVVLKAIFPDEGWHKYTTHFDTLRNKVSDPRGVINLSAFLFVVKLV